VPLPDRRALAPLILLLAPSLFGSDDFRVVAGTVEDQRYSDARLGGLTIELKLTGDSVKEVKALRARVKSAKDDVGSVLSKPDKDEKAADFEEFSPDRHPGPSLRLSSPSRDASTINIAAELELFIPARDPNTKQRFGTFLTRLDKPISSSALKAAKVEITPLSPGAYKARQQQNKPTKEQIMEEGKKHGATETEIKQAIGLMDALSALGADVPSETSVLLETKDPDGRIISIDVVKGEGSELHAPSRGSSGGREDKLLKIDLSEKPPADAALLVTLRTPKSIVTIPLNFKEVALP
jgi:hypothetical protein